MDEAKNRFKRVADTASPMVLEQADPSSPSPTKPPFHGSRGRFELRTPAHQRYLTKKSLDQPA